MFGGDIVGSFKKNLLNEEKVAKTNGRLPLDEKKMVRDVRFLMSKYNAVQGGDNKILKNYINAIEATQGDYSRRSPKILDKVTYMATFAKEVLKMDVELQYTILGVFTRVWDLLKSPHFITLMSKVSRAAKVPETKDSATVYLSLYYCFAFFLEMMTVYLVKYEMLFTRGIKPLDLAKDFMEEHRGFTRSIGFGISSFVPMFENPKLTPAILESIEEEKRLAEAKKKGEKIAREDLGLFSLGALAVGVTIFVASLFIIRNMFYWIANMKVDLAKQLELEAELLTNNIRALKIQLEAEKDPAKRKKLQEVIKKQEAWVNDFDRRSKEILGEEIKASYETKEEIEQEDAGKSGQKQAGENDDIFL